MFQSVPQIKTSKPRLVGSFPCWQFCIIQVVGANILFIAETDTVLQGADDSGATEALQINQASGIFVCWWKGDMWAAGSAPFKALFIFPGTTTGSMADDYAKSGSQVPMTGGAM